MKILIIEDEIAASDRLRKLIKKFKPQSEILSVLQDVESSIQWLHDHQDQKIDLALVDIQLADGTSFEIFEAVEIHFPVIFTTAYDEYAIKAFRVHAIDYLLKPIKAAQLEEALEKYERIREETEGQFNEIIKKIQASSFKKRFIAKIGRTIHIVHSDDIAFFYTESKITFLTTLHGKRYPLEYSLDHLVHVLDPAIFNRANRQFIVNINAISQMYTYSKSRLKLNLNPPAEREVIVSTERSGSFKKWLAGEI